MKIGILHISDLHIDEKSCGSIDSMLKKLVEDIKKVQQDADINIEFVCFTGDLVSRGDQALDKENQIELAETHFIKPLLDAINIKKKNFILVPGNHEINQDKIDRVTEKGLSAINDLSEINETIEYMDDMYKNRISYFYDYIFKNYIKDAHGWNLGYSVEREVNNIKFGFVGLDSAWRSSGSGDKERGTLLIGKPQIDYHYEIIKDASIKICLMHHPLDWLSDKEMKIIERELGKFDIVLRGHVHDLEDKQVTTQQYSTIFNTAGKLNPISEFYSGYSIINIDIDNMVCDIYQRDYYQSPRNNFDKGLRINEEGKVTYQLNDYSEEKNLIKSLKFDLNNYFKDTSVKHEMFKNMDSFSPDNISDFFVEPVLFDKSKIERISHEDINYKSNKIPFSDIVFSDDNIMIFGKKEFGKTTILQQIGVQNSATNNSFIPVYIDLTETKKCKSRLINMTYWFILDNVANECLLSKNQINKMMEDGKILYLLDNFEISNPSHLRWVKELTDSFPKNKFVITVEENLYKGNASIDYGHIGIEYKSVFIDSFNKNQVRAMVKKWGEGKDNLDINSMTNQIMTYCDNTLFALSPFNIAVFMTIWDIDRNFIPINEGKVMEYYLEVVLDKLSTDDFQRSCYGFKLKQDFLGYLAHKMFNEDKFYFTQDEFGRIVVDYHEYRGFKIEESKFDKIFFDKNILYKAKNNIYFTNTGILEYCIAFYATIDPKFCDELINNRKKKNVVRDLIYYSGLVANCRDLLNLLREEINDTVERNLDRLNFTEEINIGIEFQSDSKVIKEAINKNRKSMEEIDELYEKYYIKKEIEPLDFSKLITQEDKNSFVDLLTIYGGAIKNAETISKEEKKLHLETYMLGVNFQFGVMIDNFSHYVLSTKKEELPDDIKNTFPEMTDSQFEQIKRNSIEMIKILLPMGLQSFISTNIGTPKLEVVINELIDTNESKKFTRFMLMFLYCDLSCSQFIKKLKKYINEEESKDILKLVCFKLIYYYRTRFFGVNMKRDNDILELITDVTVRTENLNRINLPKSMTKEMLKKEIKKNLNKNRDISS